MSAAACFSAPVLRCTRGLMIVAQPRTRWEDQDDEALVQAAKEGDADAFGVLLERHRPFCLKLAMLLVRNRPDAEDVLQDSFAKAWQRLWQYGGRGAFRAWLKSIVSNECMMWLRDRRGANHISIDKTIAFNGMNPIASGNARRLELIDQRSLPEDEFADSELIKVFKREIRRIPPSMRCALLLADIDQLPLRDVAGQLGLSVPAAKSRLMRARQELKVRMKKFCGRKGAATLIGVAVPRTAAYARA